MRAYFLFFAPRAADYKPRLMAVVPTKDRLFVYVKNLINGTSAEWFDETWKQATPTDAAEALQHLLSGIQAGGVPQREWSIDIPEKVFDNPLHRSQATSPAAPVNKWFFAEVQKFDGTDSTIGTTVPALPTAEYQEHVRRRFRNMEDDALGAIILRTASVGQRDAPKVEPMKGQKTYTRPNGKVYYARQWGEHTDVEVVRKARAVGQTVFLKSQPGTGKTAMFEAAFGDDMYTVVGTANTQERDLMGTYVPNPNGDGTYTWYNGPLIKAALEGKVFFFDEIGLVDSKIAAVCYPLMDGRDEIHVTENPSIGTIKVAPGFLIVAATNPKAPGVRMSEAMLSRLDIKATMTTDYAMAEKVLGINAQMCRVASNLNRRLKEDEVSWAPQFRELIAFHEQEKVFGTEFAIRSMLAGVPEQDMGIVQDALNGGLGGKFDGAEIV